MNINRQQVNTSPGGLFEDEVIRRRARWGKNELVAREVRWYHLLGKQFSSSFIYLLFAAAAIAFCLGEKIDAIFVLLFVLLNAFLGFGQEYHSTRSLRLLKKFIREQAKVWRSGKLVKVDVAELVPGDMIQLAAGDKIPADVTFSQAYQMSVDESILTGESIPVAKRTSTHNRRELESERGWAGTLLLTGEALATVTATGNTTRLGKIQKVTLETTAESSFDAEMKSFSAFIIKLVGLTLGLVFLFQLIIHWPDFAAIKFLLFAIALAVGVIPEALPLVITTALSRGAIHLARHKVVPRRLSAIEDLGNIDVLCTDKTGTITKNELAVTDVLSKHSREEVVRYGLWAATLNQRHNEPPADSFDAALWRVADQKARHQAMTRVLLAELPFDPERRKNSILLEQGGEVLLIVRGAPEEVAACCHSFGGLEKEQIETRLAEEGRAGHRGLAVAYRRISRADLSSAQNDLASFEQGLNFWGVVFFSDQLKATTRRAVAEARQLGVQVKVVTGDAPEVAGAVGQDIGLLTRPDAVLTGKKWNELDALEKVRWASEYNVFARITPLQKREIIQALRTHHTVGFLGEGFNDLPALKAAHVALVVENAADISKDIADIVLLSRSLETIISGITEGRRIFANSFKYIKATMISNFGNFFALVAASLFVAFPPMLPLQILLLNLLSDFPMISIATDRTDKSELRRPSGHQLRNVIVVATVLGLISTLFDFAFFGFFLRYGERSLQTMWFMGSVLTELILIYSIRTRRWFWQGTGPGWVIVLLTIIIIPFTIILPYTELGQAVFGFERPVPQMLLVVGALTAAYFVCTEVVKRLYYRWQDGHKSAELSC